MTALEEFQAERINILEKKINLLITNSSFEHDLLSALQNRVLFLELWCGRDKNFDNFKPITHGNEDFDK